MNISTKIENVVKTIIPSFMYKTGRKIMLMQIKTYNQQVDIIKLFYQCQDALFYVFPITMPKFSFGIYVKYKYML